MNDALQRKIELLIDGELSPGEEAKLLARIEGDCDAWKQLGMTFLEDRLFRRALDSPGPCRASVSLKTDSRAPRRRRSIAWVGAAVMVGCAAFFIGRISVSTESSSKSTSIAVNPSNKTGAASPPTAVRPPRTEERETDDGMPEATEFVSMELVGRDDVPLQSVYVPLLDADRYREEVALRYPEEETPLVDEKVREALAAQGRTVDERLTLVPIQFDDGRIGVIPITNIEVRPARRPAIQ